MDPYSIGLGALSGISNLLTGGAQRKAQEKAFNAQRNDAQRQMGQQDAQFRAGLNFNRDQDRYGRAQDQYNVGRTEEADAYKRANTNALAPARQSLIAQLMSRLAGGDSAQWIQSLGSQPAVTQRADAGALATAAAAPYTQTANPLAAEAANAQSTVEQQARQRAEQMTQQYLRGKSPQEIQQYAQRLGFNPLDPANKEKWVQVFMADDREYQKLKTSSADQYTRMGGGQGAY